MERSKINEFLTILNKLNRARVRRNYTAISYYEKCLFEADKLVGYTRPLPRTCDRILKPGEVYFTATKSFHPKKKYHYDWPRTHKHVPRTKNGMFIRK